MRRRAHRDHETLRVLQSKVSDLNAQLEAGSSTLSQARIFAIKKQLARAKADKIRLEREMESPRA